MSAGPPSGLPGRAVPATDGTDGTDAGQLLDVIPLAEGGLRLIGEIDIASVDMVERALETTAAAVAGREILVEMGEVGFVDVAGTRAVVRAAGRLADGRRLVLHHPPRVLLLVLEFFPDSDGRIQVVPR